jgi:riboflavin biosynthesis pyrimidine reductase
VARRDAVASSRLVARCQQREADHTWIERNFDPEAVRQLKASTGRDLTVAGSDLAAYAFQAGLVDECHLFVAPIVVGGGTQALPDDVRLELDLRDVRRFGNGMVYLRYGAGT